MKNRFEQFLLLAYVIYTAFIANQITLSHSIITVSLASLFAFRQYLQWQEKPSLETELAQLRNELEKQINEQKESCNERLQKVEDEVGKVSLAYTKQVTGSTSSTAQSNRKIVF